VEDEDGKCNCWPGYTGPDCLLDSDLDGVTDKKDNCKKAANSGQEDMDKDNKGDR
jgi:hypothetical protein